MFDFGEYAGGFGLAMIAIIILFWLILLSRAKRNPPKGSLDLLKEKLDKGELTQEEYEAARKKQVRKQ